MPVPQGTVAQVKKRRSLCRRTGASLPCTRAVVSSPFLGTRLSFTERVQGLSTRLLSGQLLQPPERPSVNSVGCEDCAMLFLAVPPLACPWEHHVQ